MLNRVRAIERLVNLLPRGSPGRITSQDILMLLIETLEFYQYKN